MGEGLGLLPNRALSASVRRPSANDDRFKMRIAGSRCRNLTNDTYCGIILVRKRLAFKNKDPKLLSESHFGEE
jgi:hypothetical protein